MQTLSKLSIRAVLGLILTVLGLLLVALSGGALIQAIGHTRIADQVATRAPIAELLFAILRDERHERSDSLVALSAETPIDPARGSEIARNGEAAEASYRTSLERLGRSNIIWHNTNAEPIQQLTSGAVPLANCFNGRVIAANRAGGQLGFTAAYSAVSGNPYCVVSSSANRKEAFDGFLECRARFS